MKTVSLSIDGEKIKAREGDKLLWAALDNGIYIPNLCALREASEPAASCRLCFVEIEGRNDPTSMSSGRCCTWRAIAPSARARRRRANFCLPKCECDASGKALG